MTSFGLHYLLEGPISNTVTLGLRASAYEIHFQWEGSGGHDSVSNTGRGECGSLVHTGAETTSTVATGGSPDSCGDKLNTALCPGSRV